MDGHQPAARGEVAPATDQDEQWPDDDAQTPAAHSLLRASRRKFLVVGGASLGILACAGLSAELGLINGFRSDLDKLLGIEQTPPGHPHPLPDGPMSTPHDIVVFSGSLAAGWSDWSWAKRRLPDTRVTYAGKAVIALQLANYAALKLVNEHLDTTGMGYLQCWVRGETSGGQLANVSLVDGDGVWTPPVSLGDYTKGGGIAHNQWRLARAPLAAMRAVNGQYTALVIASGTGSSQGNIDLADLRFVYHPDLTPPVASKAWTYDLATVTLLFTQPMDPASTGQTTLYAVASTDGADSAYPATHPVAPVATRYHDHVHTVSVTLPQPLRAGGAYTVTLGAVKDKFGVAAAAPSSVQCQVTAQPLTLAVDAAAGRRAISPEIYGMTNVTADAAADLGVTLLRWGGNPTERYNWKLGNAFNAARDYHFQNGDYGHNKPEDMLPSALVDQAVVAANARQIRTLLTIPMLGWVARDTNPASASAHVPNRGGPPLQTGGDAIAGYDPAANRTRTSVPSRARKGVPFSDPPDLTDPTVAQDEWVYHLVKRFGSAAQGGVRYYAMGNEPDLWWMTHTDVRPAQMSYDQMRDTFLDYATAVKAVDPTALITGPVSWGWTNYFYSPLDDGADNYQTHADRNAHGGTALLAWWLAELKKHDDAAGARSLDLLDVHFYPQGGEYSEDHGPKLAAKRLRSVRALWDPTYTDESWIGKPVMLIPRLRAWVEQNYPGTKIGLTEYSWGAEDTLNGGLALGEALGVFAREGLDVACHFGGLQAGTPGYQAFKLFANYDGAGASFGGTACAATSTADDLLTCYAAQGQKPGTLLLLAINKSLDSDLTPTLALANLGAAFGAAQPTRARVWRFWPNDAMSVTQGPNAPVTTGGAAGPLLSYTFPASSMTLLRLESGV